MRASLLLALALGPVAPAARSPRGRSWCSAIRRAPAGGWGWR